MQKKLPFVLIHGAFQNAATWDLLAPLLKARGHRAIPATLTGLGTDAGSLSPEVNLETHIRDVVAILERENLRRAVLVGHSYAGMIVTGAAEHAADRIDRIVYLDAFVPEHGQSAMELMPQAIRDGFRSLSDRQESWRLRPTEQLLDIWGLDPGLAREFVKARLCDFSMQCFERRLDAPKHAANALPRTFVAGVKEGCASKTVFAPFAARARREGWPCYELPTGHDLQAEMPDAVAELLLRDLIDFPD